MLGCLPQLAAQTRGVGLHVAVAGLELHPQAQRYRLWQWGSLHGLAEDREME